MTAELTLSDAHQQTIRTLCGGAVHLPGDPGYDDARVPWSMTVDQRPAAVVYPACADEVAEVVRFAAQAGLRVAPQGTGHNAGPLGPLDDVILLRTSAMTGVTIDPVARTARAEAGTLWQDVVEAASKHGFDALHGSSPDVGVVGYSLGGGLGWFGRQHGLQSWRSCWPTVRWCAPTPRMTRICSGRCAAGAATSASSRRSSSSSTRSRPRTPAC
jgi:hypothetical protein